MLIKITHCHDQAHGLEKFVTVLYGLWKTDLGKVHFSLQSSNRKSFSTAQKIEDRISKLTSDLSGLGETTSGDRHARGD